MPARSTLYQNKLQTTKEGQGDGREIREILRDGINEILVTNWMWLVKKKEDSRMKPRFLSWMQDIKSIPFWTDGT